MTWVAVGVGGVALVGGIVESNASKNAANTQAGAAENAQGISQKEFQTITQQEQPFMQGGYGAENELNYLLGNRGAFGQMGDNKNGTPTFGQAEFNQDQNALGNNAFGSLLKPFNAQDWKQLSPAYNFQRQQGMQGTLNSDASGMGAMSGAAQKDLMGFNQGLANTSFNNAFNMYQTQQGNIYDRLSGIAQLGQNAASNTGQQGTALAGQAAQSATNIGTAQAAGQIGVANAYSNAASSASYIPWLMQGSNGNTNTSSGVGGNGQVGPKNY